MKAGIGKLDVMDIYRKIPHNKCAKKGCDKVPVGTSTRHHSFCEDHLCEALKPTIEAYDEVRKDFPEELKTFEAAFLRLGAQLDVDEGHEVLYKMLAPRFQGLIDSPSTSADEKKYSHQMLQMIGDYKQLYNPLHLALAKILEIAAVTWQTTVLKLPTVGLQLGVIGAGMVIGVLCVGAMLGSAWAVRGLCGAVVGGACGYVLAAALSTNPIGLVIVGGALGMSKAVLSGPI